MMNIGTNPTVGGQSQTIETNFLNFDSDLYGKELKIHLLHRIRSEEKFDSLDALKKQIAQDKITTQEYISA